MALPSSGAISFDNIRTEAGFSGAVSMSDLYLDGAKIPKNPSTTGIPTSGAISTSNFYSRSIYPSYLVFTAGTFLDFAGKVSYEGYMYVNTAYLAGGSAVSSTMNTGSGHRLILTGIRWISGATPDILFVQKQIDVTSKSSDVSSANKGTTLNNKIIRLYSGTGTGGTLVNSATLSTSGTANGTLNSGNPLLSANADQNSFYVVTGLTTGGWASLTAGNTYTLTIS